MVTAATDSSSRRARSPLRWLSLAILLGSLFAIVRMLPVGQGMEELQERVEGLGPAGMAIYGVVYVVAALLFVPGAVLTLGSGALFGLFWGTVVVSISSTTAAAIAYLIARHMARARVEALADRHPKFRAVDQAIGEQGWRIVFLLRLSPAFPYSASNYLYGLTAVRFWPLVLASWIAMLPGTFMYVYLGYAGRSGVSGGKSVGEWVLLGVGLVATVLVTVLVTRIAVGALRREDLVDEAAEEPEQREEANAENHGGIALPVLAGIALVAAITVFQFRGPLQGIFGPPRAALEEAYAEVESAQAFDHSAFDALLSEFVDERGGVDYAGLAGESRRLDAYLASLEIADFEPLGRDEKLAFLINAYNAFTLRLILDHYPLDSIKDVPLNRQWDDARWRLAGSTLSLNDIEHAEIRAKFREPRIHFALVCAAKGCPPLAREAYTGERLEEQLEARARYVHERETWFRYDRSEGVLNLTALYDWYGDDFREVAGSASAYAARYSGALADDLEAGKTPEVRYLDYDWSLNEQAEAVR